MFYYLDQKTVQHDHDPVESDEENDTVEELVFQQKRKSIVKRNRSAVSAEVYGEFNKQTAFVPKVISFIFRLFPNLKKLKLEFLFF
jgi:hypothetical protein